MQLTQAQSLQINNAATQHYATHEEFMQQTGSAEPLEDIGGIVVHYSSSTELLAFYDYENCKGAVL